VKYCVVILSEQEIQLRQWKLISQIEKFDNKESDPYFNAEEIT
jgi:hypothetical protein